MQSQDSTESENQFPTYKNNWVLDMIRTRAARVFWAYVAVFISFFIFGIWLVSRGNIESGIKAFFFVDENGFTAMSYIEMTILIACACFLVIKVKTVLWNYADPESHPVYRKICQWGDPVSIGEQARQELSNPRFQPGSYWSFSLSNPPTSSWIITNHYLIQSRFLYFDILRMEDLLWAYKKITISSIIIVIRWNSRIESILICNGGRATFAAPEGLIDKILAHCVENAPWAIFGYSEQLENHFNKNNVDFCALVESNRRVITKIKENQNLVVKPGNVKTTDLNNEVKLEMVLIPTGKFLIGSPASEKGRSGVETQHEVTLTKPLYIGKYQVTQEQWEAVMGDNPSNTKGAKLPVTDVSWEDCQEFIKKLNAKTDGGFRLPTEAEWEYACRAGTSTAYSFGNGLTTSDANIHGSSTKTVGSYKANAFGLYDMHGNVWEWCNDRYGSLQDGEVTDPKGAAKGEYRVFRGGSFDFNELGARSSTRFSGSPTSRDRNLGFRLARTMNIEGLSESDIKEFLLKGEKEEEEAKAKKEAEEAKVKEAQKKAAMILHKEVEENTDLGKGINLEMILIPAGKFMMGSPASEEGWRENETQHEVTLTKPFYMGKYEVTWEQWEAVMKRHSLLEAWLPRFLWSGVNPSSNKNPVMNVSWNDCQEFIKKLNAKTNGGYRLPSEAEWEYACRAGTTTAYSFGDSLTKSDANIDDVTAGSSKAVGSYKANGFGLYDMHGNVWEWCEDWYEDWYGDYPKGEVINPKGPATGEYNVLRGGSFLDDVSSARSSYRNFAPTIRVFNSGFRLARTIKINKSLEIQN